ncbi:MAG TPA: ABC transporter permease [Vicinamibacterales bacterium]|jgi:predicted permease
MRDVRYAVRLLARNPAFAVTSILTLAFCIGANTAIYSVVDRVLVRSLPFPDPDRLAQVVTHFDRTGNDEIGQTGATWEALRDHVTTADMAVTSGMGMGVNLVAGNQPQYVQQERVSAGFFRVLGVAPALGREFTRDEDRPGGPPLVILSHALWTRLGADPSLVGQRVMLRGAPHTVVGVMPARFTTGAPVDVWTPLQPSSRGEGGGQNYAIVARLSRGATWAQADAELASAGQAAMDDLYRADAAAENRARIHIVPLQQGETQQVRRPILILWAAVAAVLLIGCVNIAGLLMARGVTRAPEIATRIALGGGRRVIVRQLLVESLVLSACGGLLGVVIGWAGSRAFTTLLEQAVGADGGEAVLDLRVLAITGAVALGTSVVFGLVPALHASRVNLRETLVASGSPTIAGASRTWTRRVMVATEVALGVVLLVGAGLLIRSFAFLINQRAGFDGTHVMTATLSLQDARYQDADRINQLFAQAVQRMQAVPGVEHAAAALTLPYERGLNIGFRWRPGDESHLINLTYVTPAYFDTLRVPVLRGRTFSSADADAAAPVVVVNEAFAKRYSPDREPLGRTIVASGSRTIVGIVGDIQVKTAFGNFGPVAAVPSAYVPAAQTSTALFQLVHTWFSPSFFVRTAGTPRAAASEMQRAVQAVDPLLPFAKFRTLDDVRDEAVATPRAQATLLAALAGLALLLSALGIYGLVANSIAERTRELGIRMALGASAWRVVVTAVLPAAVLSLTGVVFGLIAARWTAATLQLLVWGIGVGDPLTFAIAGGAVLVVAVVAALVPALRVVHTNPVRALRAG